MTKEQARNILGISHSASIKTTEQAYQQKCRQLQIRMVPGNPCSCRQKAQIELAKLVTARRMLSNHKSNENENSTSRTATKHHPVNRTTTYTPTHNMGNLWNDFFDMLPIPKPVAILLLVAMFFCVFVTLLKTL